MTPDPSTGQILPGSKFGDKLTELAREAKVIVEIGTWKGMGSTYCLSSGVQKPSQFMFTLEADKAMYEQCPWTHPRVFRIWGTIVLPIEFPPYDTHPVENRAMQYADDYRLVQNAPYVLGIIPEVIDLLLLDGGEWSSHVEFTKLKNRSRIIALDDTHPDKSVKSYAAREVMLDNRWQVLADEPDDRNGWFIAKRP